MECRPLGKLLAVLMSLILLFGTLPGSQPGAQAATTGLPGTDMDCFRNLGAIKARLTELVKAYPNLAEIVDIGDSWEKTDGVDSTPGSDLQILRITNLGIIETKPVMFVVSGLDSRDILGVELNLRFAERLLRDYGKDPNVTMVLDTSEVQLLIVANPDGREELERQFAADRDGVLTYQTAWARNRNTVTCPNSIQTGVDLTRNFELRFTPNNNCEEDFPGFYKESEPETQAIATYLRKLYPDRRTAHDAQVPEETSGLVVIFSEWDSHHFVYPPYQSSYLIDTSETSKWIESLANKVAHNTGDEEFLRVPINVVSSHHGNLLDYVYGKLGIASLEMHIKSLALWRAFPQCSQFTDTIVETWLSALLKAARSTARPYEFAQGPEISSVSGSRTMPPFSQTWSVTGHVDARDYQNLFADQLPADPEGVVYSKSLPPWHESTVSSAATYTPDPSIPHLGTFSFEFQFEPGSAGDQQLFYLQAKNTNGKFGLPRAMFLTETTTETKIHILALPLISVGK